MGIVRGGGKGGSSPTKLIVPSRKIETPSLRGISYVFLNKLFRYLQNLSILLKSLKWNCGGFEGDGVEMRDVGFNY